MDDTSVASLWFASERERGFPSTPVQVSRTDQMSSENAALLAVARQANTLFVIPGGIDRLLLPLTAIDEPALAPVYQTIAAAFSTNVRSVVLTAGLPYMFALEASHRLRYRLFQCAAELEAVLDSSDSEIAPAEVLSLAAQSDADRRMRELSDSSEGRASLNHDACTVLVRSGQSEDIRHAALQLVLQASVLTWGALEVLARDVFREYLNATPEACARLISDAEVKKRFELTKISMERVADFGFDLSSRLGELLVEQNDLADLATIKAAVFALFPTDGRLRMALNNRQLWLLFQQRHLIVHRRGVVDRRYAESTGDTRRIGDTLALTPRELTTHISVVVEAASALLSAATAG